MRGRLSRFAAGAARNPHPIYRGTARPLSCETGLMYVTRKEIISAEKQPAARIAIAKAR